METITHILDFEFFQFGKRQTHDYFYAIREFALIGLDDGTVFHQHVDPGELPMNGRAKKTFMYQSWTMKLPFHPRMPSIDQQEAETTLLKYIMRDPRPMRLAFKGGTAERLFCEKFRLPCVNLEDYNCPKYNTLIKNAEYAEIANWEDCGLHTFGHSRSYHCCRSEVAVFRHWLKQTFA